MHPRLLALYNQELGHLREMGTEFAREFPKIASRLTLDAVEVADPYVERLLEGFAFLAARVQLKIEAEFPTFVQHLMEVAYPNLAAPVPSMLIARSVPETSDPALVRGVRVARGARLRSRHVRGSGTSCEFRTAHEVTLWPLEIEAAQYFTFAPDLPLAQVANLATVRGGLRIKLRVPETLRVAQLELDRLCFYISAPDDPAFRLYELIFGAGLGAVLFSTGSTPSVLDFRARDAVAPVGFDEDQALLPMTRPGFRGYRLLQEYTALPQRFLFFEVRGLSAAFARCAGRSIEIVLPFSRGDAALEPMIDRDAIALYCTPAINLFRKKLDRVDVTSGKVHFHVVADRARPIDFEVREIASVTAYGDASVGEQRFRPLYASSHEESVEHRAYFTVEREPRVLPAKSRIEGGRSTYVGTEVYLALVDRDHAPYRADLRQLAIDAWCTNRDLPLLLPGGGLIPSERNDFELESAVAPRLVQCLRGPSAPREALVEGRRAWSLIAQLNLNYLSIVDADAQEGAAALRSMLMLYCDAADAALRRQIDGIRAVATRRIARRIPGVGPLALVGGIEVTLTIDLMAFEGASPYLLGAVLHALFARHAAINSFVELVVQTTSGADVMRSTPLSGMRPIL